MLSVSTGSWSETHTPTTAVADRDGTAFHVKQIQSVPQTNASERGVDSRSPSAKNMFAGVSGR